jgi:hypothetical protein
MSSKPVDVLINTSEQRKAAYPPSRLVGLKPPKPGEVRNPRGRPKGSRHKLSEAFLAALLDSWLECGPTVLRKFAEQDPVGYLKLVADQLPPKDAKICQCEGMCENDFNALVSAIVEHVRADREASEAKAAGAVEH